MKKTSVRRAAIASLLLVFLFLSVTILLSATTKSFAAHIDVIEIPTIIITIIPDPSLTVQPGPSPTATPKPRPTATPVPTATPEPQPTATPIPTTVPSSTVGITPTVTVKPTVVATQQGGSVTSPNAPPTPTVTATHSTATPVANTSQKIASPERNPVRTALPMMPLAIGTLLTLCLGAGVFVGIRRVRTALLPAVTVNKHRNAPSMHSWQRIRTVQTPAMAQEAMPFQQASTISHVEADIPPLAIVSEMKWANNAPKTGPHRRLGAVRLSKMAQQEVVMPDLPKEEQVLPVDFEDMSFLNDPLLQDTLRHYRQKGQT